jgi:hypothetical protein
MDGLSGEEAFDKVLEALLDAHRTARQASERQNDAEFRAGQAEREASSLADEVRRLEQENKNGLPKLCELWTAAKAVSDFRTSTKTAESSQAIADLMKRLKIAFEASADWCDQIPF